MSKKLVMGGGEEIRGAMEEIAVGAVYSSGSTWTRNISFGAPHPDRYIVVPFGVRLVEGNSFTSCTIGGVTATIVASAEYNAVTRQHARIAVANIPTGSSGDVVITYSGGVYGMGASAYRMIHDDGAAYDIYQSTNANPNDTLNVSNGPVVCCTVVKDGTTNGWTNADEAWEYDIDGNDWCSVAHVFEPGSGTRTISGANGGVKEANVYASWDGDL